MSSSKQDPAPYDHNRRLLSLVTGANGHLGNNIVQELCSRGEAVWAGVRNPSLPGVWDDHACEPIKIDILNEDLMMHAMDGVDIVYACAAAPFRMSAKDPHREIYDVNIDATRILMHCAKRNGVRRVVFISSIVALHFDDQQSPTSEQTGHSDLRWNAYYASKTDSEKLALRLGRELNQDIVVVMPGTLIGGDCAKLTEAYRHLWNIYTNKISLDGNVYTNWCHVKDVARGCVQAAFHGIRGERYILAQEESSNIRDTVSMLQILYPKRRFRNPMRPSKKVMLWVAWVVAKVAKMRKMDAQIVPEFVDALWGKKMDCDNELARFELEVSLRPIAEAVHDAIEYLEANPKLVK